MLNIGIERNDLCWCKSGLKYKKCHIDFDRRYNELMMKNEWVPDRGLIKNPAQLEGIRESGKINTFILNKVTEMARPGVSTEELNTYAHELTISAGAIPAPLNYNGFTKSICTSLNDVICHGIPTKSQILKEGDILNIDVTTIYKGYFADASRMVLVGEVSPEAKKLVQTAKECLDLGLQAVKPWGHLDDIGAAVCEHAYKNGFSVVEDIGGHGVGLEFHEEPYVCHIGRKGEGMILVPGMVFTIEPMINLGSDEHYTDEEDHWTIYTLDGCLSAQWEYTIAVTENGTEILTY